MRLLHKNTYRHHRNDKALIKEIAGLGSSVRSTESSLESSASPASEERLNIVKTLCID